MGLLHWLLRNHSSGSVNLKSRASLVVLLNVHISIHYSVLLLPPISRLPSLQLFGSTKLRSVIFKSIDRASREAKDLAVAGSLLNVVLMRGVCCFDRSSPSR